MATILVLWMSPCPVTHSLSLFKFYSGGIPFTLRKCNQVAGMSEISCSLVLRLVQRRHTNTLVSTEDNQMQEQIVQASCNQRSQVISYTICQSFTEPSMQTETHVKSNEMLILQGFRARTKKKFLVKECSAICSVQKVNYSAVFYLPFLPPQQWNVPKSENWSNRKWKVQKNICSINILNTIKMATDGGDIKGSPTAPEVVSHSNSTETQKNIRIGVFLDCLSPIVKTVQYLSQTSSQLGQQYAAVARLQSPRAGQWLVEKSQTVVHQQGCVFPENGLREVAPSPGIHHAVQEALQGNCGSLGWKETTVYNSLLLGPEIIPLPLTTFFQLLPEWNKGGKGGAQFSATTWS